jgi:hypothetical protein
LKAPVLVAPVGVAATNELGATGTVTPIESDDEVVEPDPLVAVMVKVDEPAEVGMPDRTPAADSVTPVGNEPKATV